MHSDSEALAVENTIRAFAKVSESKKASSKVARPSRSLDGIPVICDLDCIVSYSRDPGPFLSLREPA